MLVPPALLDAHIDRLERAPRQLRRRIILLGIETSRQRAWSLQSGFGEALPAATDLFELATRAWRVLIAREAQPRSRRVHGITLDLIRRDAWDGRRRAGLHPREFALLWRLAEEPGRSLSVERLWHELWGTDRSPETNSLQVHMSRLRAKLKRVGARDLVETVPGEGYRLPEQRSAMFGDAPSFAFDGYLRLSPAGIEGEERMDEA